MQWNQRTCHDCKRHLSRPGAKTRQKSQGKGGRDKIEVVTGTELQDLRDKKEFSCQRGAWESWNRSKRALKARLKPMTSVGQLAKGNHFGFSSGDLTDENQLNN